MPDPAPRAADRIGDADDFLFLAHQEIVVPTTAEDAWATIEADDAVALLEALSPKFVRREITERLDDGYSCRTVSRAGFGRARGFDSVVWLDPPSRSVELQVGERTDLRCETIYEVVTDGTRITYTQSYRAKRASFASGAAISQLQARAVDVAARRLAAVERLCR